MVFMNETGVIGQTLIYMTQNITGNEFLTYFFIFLILVLIGLLFRLPLELNLAFCLPLALVLAVSVASFMPIIGLVAIFFSFFLARKFIAS